MIGSTLFYLKKKLSENIKPINALPQLVFLSSQDDDSIKFEKDAITILLINTEKEEHTRVDNPFIKKFKEGESSEYYKVYPEIMLNLYVLFVANWSDYKTGLDRLSEVISYFQANRVFQSTYTLQDGTEKTYDDFPLGVDKLTVEFITLPFAQQNEVWSSLRTTYRPSLLFKIRMLIFQQSASETDKVTRVDEGIIKIYPGDESLKIIKERKFPATSSSEPKHDVIKLDEP